MSEWKDLYPIHRAACEGDISRLELELASSKVSLNAFDDDGWAPIHYACWYGQLAAVKLLLDFGCDIGIRCQNGNLSTPLHFAAGTGRLDISKLLVISGADVFSKDADGQSPRELSSSIKENEWSLVCEFLKSSELKFH